PFRDGVEILRVRAGHRTAKRVVRGRVDVAERIMRKRLREVADEGRVTLLVAVAALRWLRLPSLELRGVDPQLFGIAGAPFERMALIVVVLFVRAHRRTGRKRDTCSDRGKTSDLSQKLSPAAQRIVTGGHDIRPFEREREGCDCPVVPRRSPTPRGGGLFTPE